MKAAIIGYSGAGKSTLAKKLGGFYDCPVLHLDRVNFEPGWKERSREEARSAVSGFLDENQENGWVIDGNYQELYQERRLGEADLIIFMNFPRRLCLWQVVMRFREYRDKARDTIAEGCNEKMDREFIRWILKDGRSRKYKDHYMEILKAYPEKTLVIKNHKELKASMIQLASRGRRKTWI